MRLSNEKFYNETLDLTIPEMKKACELYNAGDEKGAAKVFADFIKADLDAKKWLDSKEIKIVEGTAGYDEPTFADMVVDGYYISVGYLHQYKDGIIDWFYNPTFNNYMEYSFHIAYHGPIQALAKAYNRTCDKKYAERFMYIVSSWIDQCECPDDPDPFKYPLWRTLEAGVRMMATWPDAIHSFLYCDIVPDEFWVKMFKSIWEHYFRLHTTPNHYNWLTTEMRGLVTMGILYRCFKQHKEWLDFGINKLLEQMDTEIYAEGLQAEMAPGYQVGVINSYNSVEDLFNLYNVELPGDFRESRERMYSVYYKMTRPNYAVPGVNDSPSQNIKAIMTDAYKRYPENEIFNYFATDGAEGKCPDHTSTVFPRAGFVFMRTGWTKDDMWAMLDCGPEGSQHVHEDKLNFNLHAYRTDMLIDTGTYAYDTSDMRKYAVSSFGHNTGIVDGQGQYRMKKHKYGIIDLTVVQDVYYKNDGEYEVAEAYYDQGYGDDLIPVKHTRKVIFFRKGLEGSLPFFVILDDFASEDENEHDFEVYFQLTADPIKAHSHGVTVDFKNGTSMKMVSDKYPKIHIGQYAPEFRGWRPIHGPKEHEHNPAPAVTYTKHGKSASFATVIYPSPNSETPDISVELTENGFKLTVDGKSKEFAYDAPEIKGEHI